MNRMTPVRSARIGAALLLIVLAPPAGAEGITVKRNAEAGKPYSSTIWAGDTLYVSGALAEGTLSPGAAPGTRPTISGDTHAQTLSTLTVIQRILKEQGLGMGDVIQMHVYLAGDPALGGKMDFAGMNSAYGEFFGTKEQPNKPVRAAVQVAALALPTALVEIEVVAVRPKAPK